MDERDDEVRRVASSANLARDVENAGIRTRVARLETPIGIRGTRRLLHREASRRAVRIFVSLHSRAGHGEFLRGCAVGSPHRREARFALPVPPKFIVS